MLLQSGRELRALHAELSFAARPGRREVGFGVGAPANLSRTFVLRDLNLGIELITKEADPTWELKWQPADGTQAPAPSVGLLLKFSAAPFAIRTRVRDELTDEIRRTARHSEREVYRAIRPSGPGQPAVMLKVTISPGTLSWWPHVHFTDGAFLHRLLMADAEQAVVA